MIRNIVMVLVVVALYAWATHEAMNDAGVFDTLKIRPLESNVMIY
jgi:hypothetical protein